MRLLSGKEGYRSSLAGREQICLLKSKPPDENNKHPKPPLGDIRMIVGGTTTSLSKMARKTYLRMVQNVQQTGVVLKIPRVDNPIIGFSKEDA